MGSKKEWFWLGVLLLSWMAAVAVDTLWLYFENIAKGLLFGGVAVPAAKHLGRKS